MTFNEWWMKFHPAEVDELHAEFVDCWNAAVLACAVTVVENEHMFSTRAACHSLADAVRSNVPRNRQAPDANAAGDCPC